jgi:hypothetical protein
MDMVITLRLHKCENFVNQWKDSPPKEWDFSMGFVMLVLHILIYSSCLCVIFVCTCDHVNQSSG